MPALPTSTYVSAPQPSGPAPAARLAAPVTLPERPPFVAYVSNLPFSSSEADVRALFGALAIEPTGVRLPVEKGSDKHKGFAYVTFQDGPTLLAALHANGGAVQGRAARVSIADPTSNPGKLARTDRPGAKSFFSAGGKAAPAGPADFAGTWRSSHSAAPPPAPHGAARGAGHGAGRGAGRGPATEPAVKGARAPASPAETHPPPQTAAAAGAAVAPGGGRGDGAAPPPAPAAAAAPPATRAPAPKAPKPVAAQPPPRPAPKANAFAMLAADDDGDASGADSD
ncbi:hypothetical protein KFE25_013051 [Diacronema lutheri]|uniref:RRM domain-containing protein n=1 Tax=Diacronema lutheri TaxID=2081491 RepID=A0A8J5XI90_DIALT|nr:hypothetical protein KFE25_013051 [Diacronema lutheri]